MDEMVRELVNTCIPCLSRGKDISPEPIRMTRMPNAPWVKLHIDFKGPLPGGKYLLVVVDRYSRYPEVEIVTSTNAVTVIRTLTKIFATHGIPEIIITDNGPPFHSHQFKKYMQQIGTFHQLSTPYWPQGNAEAERFMRTLGKMLAIAKLENEDLQDALSRFLFQYRNSPHSTTRVPPAELLYNRNIRGKIPAEQDTKYTDRHHVAKKNEVRRKLYNQSYADIERKTAYNNIKVGDYVLVKQNRTNKLMTRFSPEPCKIVNISGPEVTVLTKDGRHLCRNKSYFKKVPVTNEDDDDDDNYTTSQNNVPNIVVTDFSDVIPENTAENVRKSSRTRTIPERYGIQIPSKFINDST